MNKYERARGELMQELGEEAVDAAVELGWPMVDDGPVEWLEAEIVRLRAVEAELEGQLAKASAFGVLDAVLDDRERRGRVRRSAFERDMI